MVATSLFYQNTKFQPFLNYFSLLLSLFSFLYAPPPTFWQSVLLLDFFYFSDNISYLCHIFLLLNCFLGFSCFSYFSYFLVFFSIIPFNVLPFLSPCISFSHFRLFSSISILFFIFFDILIFLSYFHQFWLNSALFPPIFSSSFLPILDFGSVLVFNPCFCYFLPFSCKLCWFWLLVLIT